MLNTDKNHFFVSSVDFTNLPQGFIVDNIYRVVRSLQKGSGGTVYLVEVVKENEQDGDLQKMKEATTSTFPISLLQKNDQNSLSS